MNQKLALFGGTFDPVHLGHIKLAETARKAVGLDRVIFVPCHQSPLKSPTVATGRQRLDMLQLALAESNLQDWAEVSRFELDRPGPSYSWQTALHFKEACPENYWYWILGTDQWQQIEQWAEPETLRTHLHFIVVTRNGETVESRQGWRFTSVPFDHPASATALRESIDDNLDWLPASVFQYIERAQLYR